MVVLAGRTAWTADAFLVEYASIPDVSLSRLTPKARRRATRSVSMCRMSCASCTPTLLLLLLSCRTLGRRAPALQRTSRNPSLPLRRPCTARP